MDLLARLRGPGKELPWLRYLNHVSSEVSALIGHAAIGLGTVGLKLLFGGKFLGTTAAAMKTTAATKATLAATTKVAATKAAATAGGKTAAAKAAANFTFGAV